MHTSYPSLDPSLGSLSQAHAPHRSGHTTPRQQCRLLRAYICAFVMLFCFGIGLTTTAHANEQMRFVHKPPTQLMIGQSWTIRGQVENNDELDDVRLHFRRQGESRYRTLRMKLYNGDRYRITLQAFQLRQPALEYYVSGLDVDKRTHVLFATKVQPHRIPIRKAAMVQPSTGPQTKATNTSSPADDDDDLTTDDDDTVYSASRRQQRIQQAPGVVTVVTDTDIEAAGWRTLTDILRFVVGVDLNNNGHWTDIGLRGLNPLMAYGDKLLILLNGHNMSWRQFNRNFVSASWVSVDNIKRIEIIRGPGSSLWGANALSGVINIVTKTNTDLRGFKSILGGSPVSRSYMLTLQGGQELLDGLTFRASFSLMQENRSTNAAANYEFLKLKGIRYVTPGDQSYNQNFHAQFAWRGLKLSFQQSIYDPFAPLGSFSRIGGDDSRFSTERYITKLTWASLLGSWGQVLAWASLDYYAFGQGTAYEQFPLSPSRRNLVKMAATDTRFEAGTQLSTRLIDREDFTLGASLGLDFEYLRLLRWHFPELWASNKLPLPRFSNIHLGSFVQLQTSLFRKIEITAGVRFDYDQLYDFVFTPRAAVVFTPGFGFYGKLLYGQAFKAPSFNDLYYFRKNAFYGNPQLRPESVNTFEAQLGWSRRNLLSISLNGYISLFRDLIAYQQQKAGAALKGEQVFPESQKPDAQQAFKQKDNTNSLTTYGGELEFRVMAVKNLRLNGSFGIFFGSDDQNTPLQYTAGWMGTLNASYKLPLGRFQMLFSLGALVVGPKPVPARAFQFPADSRLPAIDVGGTEAVPVPSWTAANDPSREAPMYINTYATAQFLNLFRRLDVILRFSNLFNADIYDANDTLLLPQQKFDVMLWLRARY